jgi:hypothetical protein
MRVLLQLLVFLPLWATAQPKGWQELTIANGLSQGMVYDMVQDPHGYVWVATKDGLNRYDGHSFTVYTHDPYNPYSLAENGISALLIDRRGRLWVGTHTQGLCLFDDRTGRFFRVKITDATTANAGNYQVWSIREDPDGHIWVGTDQANLFRIGLPDSLKTGFPTQPDFTAQVQRRRYSFQPHGVNTSVMNSLDRVTFLPDGQLVVSTFLGAFTLDYRNPVLPPKRQADGDEAAFPIPTKQGLLWLTADNKQLWVKQGAIRHTITLPTSDYLGFYVGLIDPQTVAVASPQYLWLFKPGELFQQ